MQLRMKLTLTAALAALLLLSACQSPAQPSESAAPTPSQSQAVEVVTTPEPSPDPSPEPSEEVIPTFNNMTDLGLYLKGQAAQGKLTYTFIYQGNTSLVTDQTILEILSALDVQIKRDSKNRKMFHVTATPFPGDRIVAAHESGDTSALSEDEVQVLAIVEQMVAEAQAASTTTLELERALHDMLLERVEYQNSKIRIHTSGNFPRNITIVGALLDGVANSQGYADAFYTLTTIAGLETDRMCVLKGSVPYLVNIIKLDGQWYFVDTAYNDSGVSHPTYELYNTGRNMQMIYGWGPEMEYYPIAPVRYEYRNEYADGYPVVNDLTEFRQNYNEYVARDVFDIVFEYTGDGKALEEIGDHQLADANAAALFKYPDQENLYCITIMERPGYRIVDAYFSGDTSNLVEDEIRALNEAVRMVEEAKAEATDMLDLERRLHDMLVDRITYDTDLGVSLLGVIEPLPYLTVVGALLDGVANCQGYTDAFYVLASIAGFEVDKMVVGAYDPGDHIVNVIKLDGQWYIVDVTFDDGEGVLPYFMFNVGVDLASENYASWGEEAVDHPLTEISDEHYYYNIPGNELPSFTSLADAAEYVMNAYKKDHNTNVIVLLRNQKASPDSFQARLTEAAEELKVPSKWGLYMYPHALDTVFRIEFQK